MSALANEILPQRAAIDGAVFIPYNLLAPSKTNPRKHFDPKKVAELAENIKKHGVLQPILVRAIEGAKKGQPLYEVVAGERRWRASGIAKQEFVPAIVKHMNDREVLEFQMIENLQREDLHPLEEAEGYQALMRLDKGVLYANVDELAARIGKSRSYVFGRMKLCALIEPAKKAFLEGQINASTALLIARMPADIQIPATKRILQGWGGEPASFRQARDLLESEFMLKLGSAPFKIADADLVPAAGSCKTCPKRTGANPDLFDDIKSGDVCTDPPCFAKKKEAHQAQVIAIAKESGREVITGAEAKKAMPYGPSQMKGFVKLDGPSYQLGIYNGGQKNIGQLLGKDAPETILIEDPDSKDLVEVVRTADATKVLKEKGVIKTGSTTSSRLGSSDYEKKRRAKAMAENAFRSQVATRILAEVVDKKFDAKKTLEWLMPEVATAMWCELHDDTKKRVDKLLGWEPIKIGYEDAAGEKKFTARLITFTAAQLDQVFVAMTIGSQISVNEYGMGGKGERLLRIAKGLRVDADKIKAELAAAARAKVKKPAAKKAAAKKPAAKKVAKVKTAAASAARKHAAKKAGG